MYERRLGYIILQNKHATNIIHLYHEKMKYYGTYIIYIKLSFIHVNLMSDFPPCRNNQIMQDDNCHEDHVANWGCRTGEDGDTSGAFAPDKH